MAGPDALSRAELASLATLAPILSLPPEPDYAAAFEAGVRESRAQRAAEARGEP